MNNVFLSNGSPYIHKKMAIPIYTYVSAPAQPSKITSNYLFCQFKFRNQKCTHLLSVEVSHQTEMMVFSPAELKQALSSRILVQPSVMYPQNHNFIYQIELDDSESCRKMIVKLSKEFESLRTFILDGKAELENKALKEKVVSLTAKLERVQQEYQHNLEIVSVKVDEILNENYKLKYQLEQCKEDREEEYEYLKQKQMKFLEECHEVMKIRKILDTELLDASKENRVKLIELKDNEIRTLLGHIDSFKHQISDQQQFLKQTYEHQLKKMHNFLQSTSDYDEENDQVRRLKVELQMEKDSKRKLEKLLKECNHEKSTKDDPKEEFVEQLIREKIKQEQACNYFSNELQQVSNENEALKQEVENLHQMINHRSVEFQFVQTQLNNEKDDLYRINQQYNLSEQLKCYQSKDDSSFIKEMMRLKQKLEQKERENDELIDELENIQKMQTDDPRFIFLVPIIEGEKNSYLKPVGIE